MSNKKSKAPTAAGVDRWLPIRIDELRDEDYVAEALSRPSLYELRNRASGHGLPIQLAGSFGVFWSKGFMGCEFGCGHELDDPSTPMHVSVERKNGVVKWRRGCRKQFNLSEEE